MVVEAETLVTILFLGHDYDPMISVPTFVLLASLPRGRVQGFASGRVVRQEEQWCESRDV